MGWQRLTSSGVLEIAFEISQRLPEANFLIHSLELNRGPAFKVLDWMDEIHRRISFDSDPFLEVQFGGESYFVAVWDEPGFDGKLMQVD